MEVKIMLLEFKSKVDELSTWFYDYYLYIMVEI